MRTRAAAPRSAARAAQLRTVHTARSGRLHGTSRRSPGFRSPAATAHLARGTRSDRFGPWSASDDVLVVTAAGPAVVVAVEPGRSRGGTRNLLDDGVRLGIRHRSPPGSPGTIVLPGVDTAIAAVPDAGHGLPARRRGRVRARRGLRTHHPAGTPGGNRGAESLPLARCLTGQRLASGPRVPRRLSGEPDEDHRIPPHTTM